MLLSPQVEVKNLHYAYKRRAALRGVSFTLDSGITGLLGPNGAGKTTLMSILASLLRPQGGSASINSRDLNTKSGVKAARELTGYLPQRFSVSGMMTVREHVEYSAWTHGVDDKECRSAADYAMSVVALDDLAVQRARTLSGGQRQRLGIACAIAHRPQVLLLDEPTVGLDPLQRVQVRRYLHGLGEETTVLVSTHLVDDVAHIARKLLVINEGRLVFEGAPSELAGKRSGESTNVSSLESGYEELVLGHRVHVR